MAKQHLQLLGAVKVAWQNGSPPRFRSQRTMALLGYLVAEQRPLTREFLATLFWPDEDPAIGKANLRRELHNLAQILPGCWQTSRVEVEFVPGEEKPALSLSTGSRQAEAEVAVDITQFLQFESAQQWQDAAALIGGNFLEGIVLTDNLEFESWLLGEQERWRQRSEFVLNQLINQRNQQAQYQEALRYARQLLQIMPWNEEVHYQVMLLLAKTGQRAAALKQFADCRQILAAELNIEPMPATVILYERIQAAREQPVRHNLPADITEFVGREKEQKQLQKLLAHPQRRLITIVGLGGIGKTRLALSVAKKQINAFLEGVYFVPLASLESAVQLSTALATTLDFVLQGQQTPEVELLNYFRDRELLLVLDNFEHLLADDKNGAAVVFLTKILDKAAEVKILVTSRERLKVQGEWVVNLGGLAYPRKVTAVNPAKYSAVQLFMRSVQRVRPHYDLAGDETAVLDETETAVVSRICQLVDGSPLALELAAAWANILPAKDILSEIQKSLDFLKTDAPHVPPRQRSIRAVFDATWRRLNAQERDLFAQLSIFQGGVTRTAVLEITGATLQTLSALVNKACLQFEPAHNRYYMHELLRQYGAEKLGGTQFAVGSRMAHFYLTYAQTYQKEYAKLRPEWPNIMAGMRIAYQQADWSLVITYAEVLIPPWKARARYADMRLGLAWAKEAAEQLNEEEILAQILLHWGEACIEQNDYKEADMFLSKSLAHFQRLEVGKGIAAAQYHLARIAIERGDYADAEKRLQQSFRIQQQRDDKVGMAAALYRMARILHRQGKYAEANKLARRTITLQIAENASKIDIIRSKRLLASILAEQEAYTPAQQMLEEALEMCRAIGNIAELAATLSQSADICRRQNQLELAENYAKESVQLFARMGDRKLQGVALYRLSIINEAQKNLELALQIGKRSRSLLEAVDDKFGLVYLFVHLGDLFVALGKMDQAQTIWQEAFIKAQMQAHPALATIEQRLAR